MCASTKRVHKEALSLTDVLMEPHVFIQSLASDHSTERMTEFAQTDVTQMDVLLFKIVFFCVTIPISLWKKCFFFVTNINKMIERFYANLVDQRITIKI